MSAFLSVLIGLMIATNVVWGVFVVGICCGWWKEQKTEMPKSKKGAEAPKLNCHGLVRLVLAVFDVAPPFASCHICVIGIRETSFCKVDACIGNSVFYTVVVLLTREGFDFPDVTRHPAFCSEVFEGFGEDFEEYFFHSLLSRKHRGIATLFCAQKENASAGTERRNGSGFFRLFSQT